MSFAKDNKMNYKSPDNSLHFIEPEFEHLLPAGSVQITDAEAAAIRAANQPVVDPKNVIRAQIRALEQTYADAQAKLTRQSLLTLALDKYCADPAAVGLKRDQVHEILMATGGGYAQLFKLEQTVAELRAQL
jgi:hypothetical protein